jgi:predicted DNA-binding ribbon-helix-helix protein
MWDFLKAMVHHEQCAIHDICSLIHLRKKSNTFLTAAIRVFIVRCYRAAVTEEGHTKAGHGDFSSMIYRARVRLKPLQNPPHNLSRVFTKENLIRH